MVGGGAILTTSKINQTTANGPAFAPDILVAYGSSVGTIGDLNDDGVDDLLVGASLYDGSGTNRGGAVVHFMNADGTMDATARISDNAINGPVLGDNDAYGSCVAGIGDLNDDGVEDLVVGAPSNDTGGTNRGAVFVSFMNADGSVDGTVKIAGGTANGPTPPVDEAAYGSGCAGIGDINGDGVEDIAVGSIGDNTGGVNRGAVYVHFMNADGGVDGTVKIASGTANLAALSNGGFFGTSVANIGDVNGDGVTDLAVGGRNTPPNANGGVFILFMNTDGSIDATAAIVTGTPNGPALANGDRFGVSVAPLGDWDKDGTPDLLVGAYLDDTAGTDRGAAYVILLNADGSVKTTYKLDDTTANGAVLANSNTYGSGVTSVDLDRDGLREIFVGTQGDTSQRGALYYHKMRPVTPTLQNQVTLSRLKAGESADLSMSFGLSSELSGVLTVTFPAGFTVTGAATSGSCSGGGTLGSFDFTSSTLIAVKSGCSGTVSLAGATVTLPVTPGSYTVSWTNDDPGETSVVVLAEDAITVTASVDPVMMFDVWADTDDCAYGGTSGDYVVNLGTLNSSAVTTSDPHGGAGTVDHICVQLDTNAANGVVVTVRSLHAALQSASVPADSVPSNVGAIAAGVAGYGICLNRLSIADTAPAGAFQASGGSQDDWGGSVMIAAGSTTSVTSNTCDGITHGTTTALDGSTQSLLNTADDGVAQALATLLIKAAVSGTSPAHTDYSDTLTFVATGVF